MSKSLDLQSLMEKIGLDKRASKEVFAYHIPDEEYRHFKDLLYKDEKDFYKAWQEKDDKYIWALDFFLNLGLEAYKAYQDLGISDKVYFDSMKDIRIWSDECFRKYGSHGLAEVLWIGKTVKLEVFRLGRLQFEELVLDKEIGRFEKIQPGVRVLSLHIAEGEKLDILACLESISQAIDFYGLEGDYEMICESWLLSPLLNEVLPENSNILKFQELFDLLDWHFKYPQAEERIFKDLLENKEDYPEKTTLQRLAKPYFIKGRDFGIGLGKIKEEYLNKGNK